MDSFSWAPRGMEPSSLGINVSEKPGRSVQPHRPQLRTFRQVCGNRQARVTSSASRRDDRWIGCHSLRPLAADRCGGGEGSHDLASEPTPSLIPTPKEFSRAANRRGRSVSISSLQSVVVTKDAVPDHLCSVGSSSNSRFAPAACSRCKFADAGRALVGSLPSHIDSAQP